MTVSIDTQEKNLEINLTSNARQHLSKLMKERNLHDHGLRVFVSGGGCSGMQYGMAMENESREFDTVIEDHGVKVFIDPTSLMYMRGSSIDYVDSLMGGGFSIDNPQAVASCGCGHSFRTTENGSNESTPNTGGGCGSGGCG
ncbi:MAG TPA: iron-sulfur cluster assembly accessory protein [Chloroflexi bacterium]|nr:iron-sulfur cluster assembly accessory protein [Chloroflexota bacterium]HCU98673.1 iron-sulfur cluster assembly accessory protein [Chloroflexota bacterium]|tara:strand:- start:1232 stop:1657 length:426 start_codon:yes stop_codon:yes gene_type:complete